MTPEHPSWCDLSLCDAVIGDEVQDYSGAHRSARVGLGAGWSLVAVEVVDARQQPPFLVLTTVAGTRVAARKLTDVGPEVVELLAKAGYTTPHQPDTPSPDTWAQELGYPSADALFESTRQTSTGDGPR